MQHIVETAVVRFRTSQRYPETRQRLPPKLETRGTAVLVYKGPNNATNYEAF
jgi:hypothetical protein